MTPTMLQLRRSHTKNFLRDFARPSVIEELYEVATETEAFDEAKMLADLYRECTGNEIGGGN